MDISIVNRQKKVRIPREILTRTKKVLRHKRLKGRLTIVFVTDVVIKKLNQKYLKHDYATDVITFDYSSQKKELFGEIVISIDTARRQAKSYGTSMVDELTLYVFHGILHLLGFDDHQPKDIRKMKKKEQELMQLT